MTSSGPLKEQRSKSRITRRAVEVLSNGFNGQIMINAYSGAFSDPQARASDLRIAVDELRKALQLLEATEWPTDADYRRL